MMSLYWVVFLFRSAFFVVVQDRAEIGYLFDMHRFLYTVGTNYLSTCDMKSVNYSHLNLIVVGSEPEI